MDISNQTLTDLLFLLKTDDVKSDPVLKEKIENRIEEIREESRIREVEELDRKKGRRKYKWIFLVFLVSCISYCAYKVSINESMVHRVVYHYQVPIPMVSKVDSMALLAEFVNEEFHEDAKKEFPELGDSIKERMRVNIKRKKEVITGSEQGLLKIDFVVSEDEQGKYDHNKVLMFYLTKSLKLLELDPDPYIKDINSKIDNGSV